MSREKTQKNGKVKKKWEFCKFNSKGPKRNGIKAKEKQTQERYTARVRETETERERHSARGNKIKIKANNKFICYFIFSILIGFLLCASARLME